MPNVTVVEHPAGLSWIEGGAAMARSSHAVLDGGRVWLVDPFDASEPLERVQALGEVAGVLQLLDRHERDGAAIAARLGVPLLRLPAHVLGARVEVVRVVDVPRWREVALWWPGTRTLVVPEAVGTAPAFAVGRGPAGVHPFLRAFGVGALRHWEPEVLLVGHGPPLIGAEATSALRDALARSRGDLPRLLRALPGLARA